MQCLYSDIAIYCHLIRLEWDAEEVAAVLLSLNVEIAHHIVQIGGIGALIAQEHSNLTLNFQHDLH